MKTFEDPDETSLDFAKYYKKHLRFEIGAVVYLKSDLKKKCPMTVTIFDIGDRRWDYQCEWMNSQSKRECSSFLDKVLTI